MNSAATSVLVVDDDLGTAKATALFLKLHGMDAVTAADGLSAIEFVRALKPAAIVLDFDLPHIDGLGFCTILRRIMLDTETLVIVVTGRKDHGCRVKMLEAGADRYMTKPCDLRELLSIIELHLKERSVA